MNAFLIVCAIAALATAPTGHVQAVVAAAASTLFESIPFILAAAIAKRFAPRYGKTLSGFIGCGCAHGSGARSLAVAALTLLTFGPLVAVARFIAAYIGARAWARSRRDSSASVLAEITALVPCAIGAGILAVIFASSPHLHLGTFAGVACGLMLGFFAPCTLGAVALAATMRHFSMQAAIVILAISGICDFRTLAPAPSARQTHDAFAYVIGAAACVLLAYAHGATLLNPRFTIALWLSSAALAVLAWRYRAKRNAVLRWAPALMAAGVLLSHASPSYSMTETTLTDAVAGDTLVFRGVLARHDREAALVRYAITCCRADAQPIVVQLERPVSERSGQWLEARGTLIEKPAGLALRIRTYRRLNAPTDPFVYR
ncbi:MAG: hypothetical protein JO177_02645 [Candidatus Eremiobacteraeota bacterium]|nr:hypothetical protein [Candidatus Eremiobacteraeota bacterium]